MLCDNAPVSQPDQMPLVYLEGNILYSSHSLSLAADDVLDQLHKIRLPRAISIYEIILSKDVA